MVAKTTSTANGTGEYGIPDNIRALFPAVFIAGEKAVLSHDVGWFFEKYHDRSSQPRGQPETCLYFMRALWFAPIPDDTYTVQIHALYRPDALLSASDSPIDSRWGEAIALGAASLIFFNDGDFEQAARMDGFLAYHLDLIRRTNILSWHGMRAAPQF